MTATPAQAVAQSAAAQVALSLHPQERGEPLLRELYRRSGVERRHSVLVDGVEEDGTVRQSFYQPAADPSDFGPATRQRMRRYETEAGALAIRTAKGSLEASGFAPDQITDLVTVSCTGFAAPGFDLALIRDLGLAAGTSRTHVGFMGCHGLMNGLRVAKALAQADPRACVLLCAVELCTLHHQYDGDAEQIVANALFADGAASAIVHSPSLRPGRSPAPSGTFWTLVDQASQVIPDAADQMSWRIGDHGFRMTLSPRVPQTIRETLRPWLAAWLAEHGLTIADIDGWAIHPGGPRILTACAAAAGFDPALLGPSREVLAEFGNMSSPTVFFVLDRIGRRLESGLCAMLAFGPGLAIEAALWRKGAEGRWSGSA